MGNTGNTPGFAAGAGKQITEIAGNAKENCVCVSMCVFRGEGTGTVTQSRLLPSKKHRLLRKACIGQAKHCEVKQRNLLKHRKEIKKKQCESLRKAKQKNL